MVVIIPKRTLKLIQDSDRKVTYSSLGIEKVVLVIQDSDRKVTYS
jgi:hypothetical protein